MISTIGWIVIWIGVLFDLLGAIGLLRFPDVYNRLQAATKCATLGTCGILLGLFIRYGLVDLGVKSFIAIFFLFPATVAAHALVKGAYRFGVKMWEGSVIDHYATDLDKEK